MGQRYTFWIKTNKILVCLSVIFFLFYSLKMSGSNIPSPKMIAITMQICFSLLNCYIKCSYDVIAFISVNAHFYKMRFFVDKMCQLKTSFQELFSWWVQVPLSETSNFWLWSISTSTLLSFFLFGFIFSRNITQIKKDCINGGYCVIYCSKCRLLMRVA